MTGDKCAVSSFFGVGEKLLTPSDAKGVTADVHLVFYADLEKLNIGVKHRGDEECMKAVYDILNIGSYGIELVDRVTGVENVYKEYGGKNKDRLNAEMLHPKICFRFNLKCTYDPNVTIQDINYEANNFINN
jgi:hypothetical protein